MELEEAGAIARASRCVQIRATVVDAAIAQLGERQTEDLKVHGSIPGLGIFLNPQIHQSADTLNY